jgi:hypothetical protein
MSGTPLLLPTIVVLAVAAVEWRHTRAVAWAALFAGFVLLVPVLRWPAMSISDIVEMVAPHLSALLLVARCVGAACFLYSIVRSVRTAGIPW